MTGRCRQAPAPVVVVVTVPAKRKNELNFPSLLPSTQQQLQEERKSIWQKEGKFANSTEVAVFIPLESDNALEEIAIIVAFSSSGSTISIRFYLSLSSLRT